MIGYDFAYVIRIKAHTYLYVRFCLFGQLFYQIYSNFAYFWAIFGLLKLISGGWVVHRLKMFENTFWLKVYAKLPLNSICSDDQGGFVHPSDHCAL